MTDGAIPARTDPEAASDPAPWSMGRHGEGPGQIDKILWQWPPNPDAAQLRRQRILGLLGGALLVAFGVWQLLRIGDSTCTDHLCRRSYRIGYFAIAWGLMIGLFPFLGTRLRRYLTTRYRMTATTFYKTSFGDTSEIPLCAGRVVIRYRKAWLTRSKGLDIALTPALPKDETHRFFAAVQQAQRIRESRDKEPR